MFWLYYVTVTLNWGWCLIIQSQWCNGKLKSALFHYSYYYHEHLQINHCWQKTYFYISEDFAGLWKKLCSCHCYVVAIASSWVYCLIMSILFHHEYIVSSWVYCFIMNILSHHEYIVSSWVYCLIMSILFYHEYIASSWLYCSIMSILFHHEYIVLSWVYCLIMSILFHHE